MAAPPHAGEWAKGARLLRRPMRRIGKVIAAPPVVIGATVGEIRREVRQFAKGAAGIWPDQHVLPAWMRWEPSLVASVMV